MARGLRIAWTRYEANHIPVTRLVLFRGEHGGPLQPYRTFYDVTRTQFTDRNVQPQRGPYCYRLQAVAQDGKKSDFSNEGCATPRK